MRFNKYPYINLTDLNLDFLLNAIKEMQDQVTNFVSINAIKYANPIQWSISRQYEKNTIVIDPLTGSAYISVAPVPSGVALTREDYWSVVFDLGGFVTRAAKNFTRNYEAETTTTATFNIPAGRWVVWGDTLYIAKVNITAGDSYVVDGNIERLTVEEVKDTIIDLINDYQETITTIIGELSELTTTDTDSIVNAINSIISERGSLSNLGTTDKSTIVNAINSIVTEIGALSSLLTSDTDSIVDAINSIINERGSLSDLQTSVKNSIVGAINSIVGLVGNMSALHTTDKSTLVNAINEVLTNLNLSYASMSNRVGELQNLHTTDKTSIVNAINELDDLLPNIGQEYSFFHGKNIIIFGDSLCDPTTNAPNWVTLFKNMVESYGGTVNTDFCENGASFAGVGQASRLAALDSYSNIYDYVIIAYGINDYQGQWGVGNFNDTENPTATAGYNGYNSIAGQNLLLAKIRSKFPKAIQFGIIPHRYGNSSLSIPLATYRYAIGTTYQLYGVRIIDWSSLPMFAPAMLGSTFGGYTTNDDTLHPTSVYAPILMKYTKEQMLCGGSNNWKVSGDYFRIPVTGSSGYINGCQYSDGRYHLTCAVNFTTPWTDSYKVVLSNENLNYLTRLMFDNAYATFNGGKVCSLQVFGNDIIAYNPDGYNVTQLYMNIAGTLARPTSRYYSIYD